MYLAHRFILFFTLFFALNIFAQRNSVDSVFRLLKNAGADTARVRLTNVVGEIFFSFNPDSALIFWKKAEEMCNEGIKKSIEPDLTVYRRNLAESFNSQGAYLLQQGNIEGASEIWDRAIALRKLINDRYGIALALFNSGYLYFSTEEFPKAIDLWVEAEKLATEIGSKEIMSSAQGALAGLYGSMGDFVKAEELYDEMVNTKLKNKDNADLGLLYYNLAASSVENGKIEKAKKCLAKSEQILKSAGDLATLVNVYSCMSGIYLDGKQYDSAIVYLNKRKEISLKLGLRAEYGRTLADYSQYYRGTGNLKLAETAAKEVIAVGEELGSQSIKYKGYLAFSSCALLKKDFESAYRFYVKAVQIDDSIRKKNDKTESLKKQLLASYNKEKRATQKEQDRVRAIAEQENRLQKYVIYGIGAGFLMLAVFAFLLFSRFKITKRQKEIIEKQSAEVHRQKDLVEEKQKEIIDSIKYAKRIQQSLLTSEKYVDRILRELNKKS